MSIINNISSDATIIKYGVIGGIAIGAVIIGYEIYKFIQTEISDAEKDLNSVIPKFNYKKFDDKSNQFVLKTYENAFCPFCAIFEYLFPKKVKHNNNNGLTWDKNKNYYIVNKNSQLYNFVSGKNIFP